MLILLTPPECHFDKGLGVAAWSFKEAAELLLNAASANELLSPASYLQRHSIELHLKSLIYILHKKYNVQFGDSFSLERPAILVKDKWISLSNTHNLADLYGYFIVVFDSLAHLLPHDANWKLPQDLVKKVNLISGYDPKSTYFRYPETGNQSQDQKKSTIQPMDKDTDLTKLSADSSNATKCSLIYNTEGKVEAAYRLFVEPLTDVKKALTEVLDIIHGLHCQTLAKLTDFS